MTSNTNQSLTHVWGASATSVWAVGGGGAAIYFDGSSWQSRPTPTTNPLVSIHGTSPSNVFVAAVGSVTLLSAGSLIEFDGSVWKAPITVHNNDYGSSCVFALGAGDALVAWAYGNLSGSSVKLYRFTNGTVMPLASGSDSGGIDVGGCDIHAFSPTDVYISAGILWHYTGSSTLATQFPAENIKQAWVANQSAMFFVSTSATSSAGVTRWNGSSSTNISPGWAGSLQDLSGTSPTRVFAAAATTARVGAVLAWDGVGWNIEATPPAIGFLYAIWAAPTGEVFAVGADGLVVRRR